MDAEARRKILCLDLYKYHVDISCCTILIRSAISSCYFLTCQYAFAANNAEWRRMLSETGKGVSFLRNTNPKNYSEAS
jgi:hypothetical protein